MNHTTFSKLSVKINACKNSICQQLFPHKVFHKRENYFYALFSTFYLCTTCLIAQNTNTWTGTTSSDWNTPSNWSANTLPIATDNVVIPSNPANQPSINASINAIANSVEVQSGAILIIAALGNLTINGSKSYGSNTSGLYNNGTLQNNGKIILGTSASVGKYGLWNRNIFNNNAGGEIEIDNANTYSIYNEFGTFTNAAKITMGPTISIGGGLYLNNGVFNNNLGGDIKIDGAIRMFVGTFNNLAKIKVSREIIVTSCSNCAPVTFNNNIGGDISGTSISIQVGGTFDNAANLILIGDGISLNRGKFNNNAGGNVNIRGSGLAMSDFRSTFYNAAKISIAGGGISKSDGVFTNSTSGEIEIDSTINAAISIINGGFGNEGKITIGAKNNVGGYGISQVSGAGGFTNSNSGIITINKSLGGIQNTKPFYNSGSISIGTATGMGQYGIKNSGSFNNEGEIKIDNIEYGIFHDGNVVSFSNSGNILIGSIASSGQVGIYNGSRFSNSGNIKIDKATNSGIQNISAFQGEFTNTGKITLGSIASVGQYGINNSGSFNNSGCSALINIMSNSIIENSSTFTNSGTIIENATGNSSISINTGIVQNLNGGTFTMSNTQPLNVTPTNPTACGINNGSALLDGLHSNVEYSVSYTVGATTTTLAPNPVSSADGKITIPNLSAGIYSITLEGGCLPIALTLSVTLTNPLPISYSLTGGGSICGIGDSTLIGISGSDVGVNYQLKHNGDNIGSPIAGTGSSFSFGSFTIVGSYTVIATSTITNCSSAESQPVAIIVGLTTPTPLPNPIIICLGKTALLSASGCSGAGVVTQWFRSSDNLPVTASVSPSQTTDYYAKCVKIVNNVIVCSGSASMPLKVQVYGSGPNYLQITQPITSGTVVQSASTIEATNQISGGNVEYQATQSIMLNPGFSSNNTTFKATVVGCD